MKVLVTGVTGGIGELIAKELLKRGITVIGTSRDAEKAKASDIYDQITYIPYDFNSPLNTDLFTHFHKPDLLIHPAWEKLNEFKNQDHVTIYLENHKKFIASLIENGLKSFSGVGTCYECGLHEGILDEECTSPPTLPYAEAKNLLRQYAAELCAKHKVTYKWIRMFYVFGEVKGRKNLYTLLNEAIKNKDEIFNMSGGEQVRDFSTPREYAEKIVKISLQDKVNGIINCCSGKPVKLKDFVTEFLSKNNYKIKLNLGHYPYPDYEPMATWGSLEKLNKILP